ncbi:MAG: tandem-95 repeat protein [Deltaproteobacteria bacterium]|nr:tandem-95 repeat protein [Deltaproteobacteria bacterium]
MIPSAALALVLVLGCPRPAAAQLVIDPTSDAERMVDALIARGIDVVMARYEAADEVLWWSLFPFSQGPGTQPGTGASGVYAQGPLGLRDGLLMTSGEVMLAAPPNRSLPGTTYPDGRPIREGATGVLTPDIGPPRPGQGPEAFCASLIGDDAINPHDVVKLTIDFTLDPGYDGIQLDYVFGSEEYPDYVGSLYPDAFGFFVRADGAADYTNFGLDPDGHDIDINGPFFSSDNVIESYGEGAISEYNGLTPHLRSAFPLVSGPERLHRIVIVICDAGDQYLDSGVFLTALAGCQGACDQTTWCGDGKVQPGEACDDGDVRAGDGCDPSCEVEPGWACTRPDGGLSVCLDQCGDGVVQGPWEQCDDQDDDDRDDCTRACRAASCTDGLLHDRGSGTETGVDCGGDCPGCPDGDPCDGNGDCASGFCLLPLGVCGPAPITDAKDDLWRVLAGAPRTIARDELLGNDVEVAPATFAPDLTSERGAAVGFSAGTGLVTYTAPVGVVADAFDYLVCNPFVPSQCDVATVTVLVNRPPVVGDVVTWVALGAVEVTLPRARWYADPDGDAIDVATVDAPALATGDGALVMPLGPEVGPGPIALATRACDAGFPSGCDDGSWTIVVNDPPEVRTVELTLATGAGATVPLGDYLDGLGLVAGDDPADGDADGLAPLWVGDVAAGPFGLVKNLGVGSCAIDPITGAVDLVASASLTGVASCFVRVCEELPAADPGVCSIAEIILTVVPCVSDDDCAAPSPICDEVTSTCIACRDAVDGVGVDPGCGPTRPLCEEGDGGATCVGCLDDAGAGEVDTGCGTFDNACDVGPTTRRCVDCQTTPDCAGDLVCEPATRACVPCRDTAAFPATDDGCDEDLPICRTAGTPTCVECTLDAHCGGQGVCHPGTFRCVPCRDTQPLAGLDAGCTSGAPMCEDETCTTCLDDQPAGRDLGCGALRPACDEDAQVCVGCTSDADCFGQGVCDPDLRACVPCRDTAAGAGLDAGCGDLAPMCEGERCVTCVDDADAPGTDLGCSAAVPTCDALAQGGPRCVECTSDLDCPTGRGHCEPVLDVCVECLEDQDCDATEACVTSVHRCVERGTALAVADQYGTNEGVTLEVGAPGVIDNDLVPPGLGAPSVTLVAGTAPGAALGALALEADGALRFTPAAGYHGALTFRYRLTAAPAPATEADVVIRVNGAPDPLPDVAATTVDVPIAIVVLDNDDDPEGDALHVAGIPTPPAHGSAVFGEARVTYTPAPGWSGIDRLDYQVCDPHGACATAGVVVTVDDPEVPEPPRALPDRAYTSEDVPVLVVVAHNDDPALVVTAVEVGPAHGDALLIDDGTILYTPDADWSGVDLFTYRTCAGEVCVIAPVRIDVAPVNDPPRARDDAALVAPGSAVDVGVLGNDDDPDGDALGAPRVVEPPARGTAEVVGRDVRYQPDAGVVDGDDRLTYETCDTSGACARAEVVVTIDDEAPAPSVQDDAATTGEGEPVVVPVLDNDGPTGIGLRDVCTPMHGSASVVDGQVVYTPEAGFVGQDAFCYTACIGAACEAGQVTVTVTAGPNLPPVALDDRATTPRDTPVALAPLDNDVDPDGDALTILSVGVPEVGTVVIDGAALTYTPRSGYEGADRFEVVVTDGRLTASSTAWIEVLPAANGAPRADDDRYVVSHAVGRALPVRTNDADPDGEAIAFAWITQPPDGIVRIDPEGDLAYAPMLAEGATPTPLQTFRYGIADPHGASDDALVVLELGDRDGDGLSDWVEEQVTHTDPDDPDTDDDGIDDGAEVDGETDPLDADTDDDGIRDGDEAGHGTDPLVCDSDGDGLCDGLEIGVDVPVPGGTSSGGVPYAGTDTDTWRPDGDPTTTTDPKDDDTDDDGLLDGSEDADGDGAVDGDETDPNDADSDDDLLQDGTELGLDVPEGDDTDPFVFRPDLDPDSTTNPLDADTDDGTVADGTEDTDLNGRIDPGERDPNFGPDDVPSELEGRLVAEGGGGCATGASPLAWLVALALVVGARARRRARIPLAGDPRSRRWTRRGRVV